MIRCFALEEGDTVVAMIDSHIEHLKKEIDDYQSARWGRPQPIDALEILGLIDQIPSLLLKARLRLRWSQEEMASATKTSQQKISKYEQSSYARLSVSKAAEIGRCLYDELVRRSPGGSMKSGPSAEPADD
jgi:hypothetical protein